MDFSLVLIVFTCRIFPTKNLSFPLQKVILIQLFQRSDSQSISTKATNATSRINTCKGQPTMPWGREGAAECRNALDLLFCQRQGIVQVHSLLVSREIQAYVGAGLESPAQVLPSHTWGSGLCMWCRPGPEPQPWPLTSTGMGSSRPEKCVPVETVLAQNARICPSGDTFGGKKVNKTNK